MKRAADTAARQDDMIFGDRDQPHVRRDLVTDRGADRGVGFRYRRNLRTVRRRIRPPEATVLYGYGASGLNVAGVNGGAEYVEDFTFYTDQGIDITTARDHILAQWNWPSS